MHEPPADTVAGAILFVFLVVLVVALIIKAAVT
jgi:hypothetical protein